MKEVRTILFTAYCLLLTASLLLASCGKKGPLTLKSYEKPETPVNLKAMHREDKIILVWSYNKKENLKGFHILRAEGTEFQRIAFLGQDESLYSDTDFKTGILYKYKVAAQSMKDVLGNDSNVVDIKPQSVPSAPKNISFKVGNDSLYISWESEKEGVLYNIYKTIKKGEYGLTPVNNEPLKTISYSDNLELTMPVYYTVRAVLNNESRDEGFASEEIMVNPENFIPSRPEGLQAIAEKNKVVLSWKENSEIWVKKYNVYRKIKTSDEFKLIGESATPTFTDKEKAGKRIIYAITAVGPSKESGHSKEAAVDF